jgi:transposase
MPERAFISIPLDIPELRVLQTEINADNEFVLTVESTRKSATCRICGRTITLRHGSDQMRTLRHLPILGRPVLVRLGRKRLRCTFCHGQATTTQQLDWYDPNGLHTKAYQQQLIVALVNSTITDLVAKQDVSYVSLLSMLDRWGATTVDWQALEPFSTLGIDEIALTKGHRNFVAVISARTDAGHLQLLAVLPDRLKTTLVAWLKSLRAAVIERITTVCTDRWEGYITAVQQVVPKATIVIDRFPVARHYRDGVDMLRKQEVKRLRAELPPRSTASSNKVGRMAPGGTNDPLVVSATLHSILQRVLNVISGKTALLQVKATAGASESHA